MKIAVVIVNYGTPELAISASESVLAMETPAEVHLVDNASPDGDAAIFAASARERGWADRVTLWLEDENHGFGRGNNLVLKMLAARPDPPDYVFLLNPDATLENDALMHLSRVLDADPHVAAVGAAIRGTDGTPAVAAFRFPGFISEVIRVTDFGPLARIFGRFRVPLGAVLTCRPVDWVSGAAVMLRLKALEDVDFFDPGFFLYYEEVDLMRRLRASGWQVMHVPDALVRHHAGAATGVSSTDSIWRRNPTYLYDSWVLYFSKSLGRVPALVLALTLLPAACINVLQSRLRGRQPNLPQKFFRDHFRYVISPLIGKKKLS